MGGWITTKHQSFIANLKKQLSPNVQCFEDDFDNGSVFCDACEEDLIKELERKFDELFGDVDEG